MNVLLTVNEGYLNAVETLVYSLRKNTEQSLVIYLLYNEIEDVKLSKLERFINDKCRAVLKTYRVKNNFFDKLPVSDHFNPIIYYRLMAQDIIPENISRILYLDVDIIINGNIDEFYERDFQGKGIIACLNKDFELENKKRLGLKEDSCYVNAGVILFNLDFARKKIPYEVVVECIEKNISRLRWYDQDVLNILYEDHMICLKDNKYNLQVTKDFGCDKSIEKKLENTRIIHFTGSLKPWMKGYREKQGRRYYKLMWECGQKREAVKLLMYNSLRRWVWFVSGK